MILMPDQQMRDLSSFLNDKRGEMIKILGDYSWEQMAADIGLTPETMRRLKREKTAKGVQFHVFAALIAAFGNELFEALDLPLPNNSATFALRLEDAKRRRKEERKGQGA